MITDTKQSKRHCVFELKGNILNAAHDIGSIDWDNSDAAMLIQATGNDPILMLPHVHLDGATSYILELAGHGPDPVWQLYYITEPGQIHSGERMINIDLSGNGHAIIRLPAGIPSQMLRLDPGSAAGRISLSKLSIYEELSPVSPGQVTSIAPSAKHGVIYRRCNGMDPADWTQLLGLSVAHSVIGDMQFPAFPSVELQDGMVGSHGEHAIREMGMFYRELGRATDKLSWGLSSASQVLDFGCGFGRLTRFFLKDVVYGNLYGADTTQSFIDICKSTFPISAMPPENFIRNEPLGSLPFADGSLDLITAYSVFSHLSENAANFWLDEFFRILKPGALLALTIRQKTYILMCRKNAQKQSDDHYTNLQSQCFGKDDGILERFESGEFIWFANGGGSLLANTFYGDTVIPDSYIFKNWTSKYLVRTLFDDQTRCWQSFLLLQKK